jgi:hypothetical protein
VRWRQWRPHSSVLGRTALLAAVQGRRPEVVELLLSRGASPSLGCCHGLGGGGGGGGGGLTPLLAAARSVARAPSSPSSAADQQLGSDPWRASVRVLWLLLGVPHSTSWAAQRSAPGGETALHWLLADGGGGGGSGGAASSSGAAGAAAAGGGGERAPAALAELRELARTLLVWRPLRPFWRPF